VLKKADMDYKYRRYPWKT